MDVRQAIAELCPRFMQSFLSRLTGKALPGQEMAVRSGVTLLIQAAIWLVSGAVGASWVVAADQCWFLLPVFWAMSVHGSRTLQVQMIHQAAHGTLVGTRDRPRASANRFLGNVLSTILLVENFDAYRRAHLHDHHHPKRLSTSADPTVSLLRSAGLAPGLSVRKLWLRLVGSLVSPLFHGRRILARLQGQLGGSTMKWRSAALLYLSALLMVAAFTDNLLTLLLAWFVPLFPLYEASATLRLCVEHEWPAESFQVNGEVDHLAMTHGVFCGSEPPEHKAGLLAWTGWLLRMIGHGLARFLVLVGDTPCHDYHHRHPQEHDWAIVITQRRDDLAADQACGRSVYTERWGILTAIQTQFERLAAWRN